MLIEITYNVTDVFVSTTQTPIYVSVSFEQPSGGGGTWGSITGTLSNQTDLQNALNAKFDDPTGTTSQYLRGDGTLATFPSLTGFVPYTGATGDVNLGTHRILAQNATISSSGSGDTVTLNHSSGSGIGLNITKGGNGEGLYINKTGGSGNAATIIGTLNATTLVKSGGTSSQFLKADGTVDSSVYVPTSREITINGVTYDLSANRSWTVSGGISGSGASGQVAYWTGTSAQAGSNNLFWDNANGRLGIGTNAPNRALDVRNSAIFIANVSGYSTVLHVENTGNTLDQNKNVAIFVGARGSSSQIGDNTNLGIWQKSSIANNYANVTFYNANGNDASFFGTEFVNHTSSPSTNFILATANSGTPAVKLKLFGNGNLLLQNGGTFTDSGQRLQVQGTTLLNGNVTFTSATGMTWDATNSRLGIGTNAPLYNLDVTGNVRIGNSTNGYIFNSNSISTFGNIFLGIQADRVFSITDSTFNNVYFRIVRNTGNTLLGSTTDSGERLQVTGTMKVTGDTLLKGSTALGGAISLTVQNSSGTNMLRVRDDGYILIGQASTSAAPTIYAFSGITGDRSLRIGIQSAGSLTPIPAFNINQESNYTYTSGTGEFTTITANFLPTSGTGTLAYLSIKGTINQTGGANGITRGLYVNPTLTAAADWRAIEWSNNTGWGLYGAGTAANYMAGNLLLGSTSNSGERLQVTGTMKVTGNTTLTNVTCTSLDCPSYGSQGATSGTKFNINPSNAFSGTTGTVILLGVSHTSGGGFIPTSGNATHNMLVLSSTINQTGTANGITRGLYVNPTLTAAADFRAIEWSNNSGWGLYGAGTANNYLGGNLLLGSTTNSGQRLQVTGTMKVTGNVGVNVTPSVTSGNYRNLQNGNAVLMGNASEPIIYFNSNATFNSGWKYIINGVSARYEQNGNHAWFIAPSGTAGNAITFTEVMTLTSSGNLGIGNSPTAVIDIKASTTTNASLRIRSGTAPTSPNDGDIWFDGTDIKMRIGGVTKTFTLI